VEAVAEAEAAAALRSQIRQKAAEAVLANEEEEAAYAQFVREKQARHALDTQQASRRIP
jgi:hypothetical protein